MMFLLVLLMMIMVVVVVVTIDNDAFGTGGGDDPPPAAGVDDDSAGCHDHQSAIISYLPVLDDVVPGVVTDDRRTLSSRSASRSLLCFSVNIHKATRTNI